MTQKFVGKVIRLNMPKTATVETTTIKIHPKYKKPQKIVKTKQVHYEVTEREIINWLIKYFQENNIKEINLKDGEMVINYNNGETVSLEKMVKRHEFQNVKDYLTKTKQHPLTAEK